MTWKQIKIDFDPLWKEFHKEVMTSRGRCNLKVWHSSIGFRGALETVGGERSVTVFMNAKTMEQAKTLALEWAKEV